MNWFILMCPKHRKLSCKKCIRVVSTIQIEHDDIMRRRQEAVESNIPFMFWKKPKQKQAEEK